MLATAGLLLDATAAYGQDGTPFYTTPARGPSSTAVEPEPPPAPPPPPDLPEAPSAPFGARGSVVVSTDSGVSFGATFYSNSGASAVSGSFAPALDVFFVRNVSVGLGVGLWYGVYRGYGADSSLIQTTSAGVSIAPRLGVNLPIGRVASFYPRASFGLEWTQRDQEVVSGPSLSLANPIASPHVTQTGFWLQLFAPILFHPKPHYFVGAGPTVFHEFARATGGPDVGGERTTLGGHVVIGGHWGGATEPHEDDPPHTRPARRFGDDHQVLLGSSTSASWTTYGGTGASTAGFTLSPSVGYFVGYRFAVTAGLGLGYSSLRGSNASTGAPVTTVTLSAGGALGLGYDVPLATRLSLFPRVSLALGDEAYDSRSGVSRNQYSDIYFAGEASLPLLVHVAPHLSLGVGPYVSHDFARLFPSSTVNHFLGTSVGASAYVAAWL